MDSIPASIRAPAVGFAECAVIRGGGAAAQYKRFLDPENHVAACTPAIVSEIVVFLPPSRLTQGKHVVGPRESSPLE